MGIQREKAKGRLKEILIFGIVYIVLFFWVEQRDVAVHIVHSRVDDLIPFCEYFIIPYIGWYFFVGLTVIYFGAFSKEDREYEGLIKTLVVGVCIFLVTSFVYPNGHDLRPDLQPANVFQWMVSILYLVDTPTNILPSLHVYNSIACAAAILRSSELRAHPWIRRGAVVSAVLIILSTMFLKQHSAVDVVLAGACYTLAYDGIYGKHRFIRRKSVASGGAAG